MFFDGRGRTIMTDGLANTSTNYLLAQGYNVVLCAHSQEQADVMTAKVPQDLRPHFAPFFCLTADPASVQSCIDYAVDRFHSLDIIACGAGRLENKSFDETQTYEEFSEIVTSHQIGVFTMIKTALPTLLKSDAPRIITFTYIEGKCGKFDCGFSSAVGKGGIVPMTRAIALEYAHTGLTANCIAVGAMETLNARSAEEIRRLEQTIPLGRIATAEDIAPAVCFLASREANYITGAVLNMSGGAYMD